MRRALLVFSLVALAPGMARASAPDLFGQGARSASLVQSDVASPDPEVAAYAGPTAAAEPGTRVHVGYSHAWTRLSFRGAPAPIDDVGGTTFAFQIGRSLSETVRVGGAISLYLPDRGLARVGFRAASEPSFVRWDNSPHRVTMDSVLALRFDRFSIAGGASFAAKAGGPGVEADLPQDARGPHADGGADVTLGYKVAPIIGLAADLGVVKLAARLRGSSGVALDLVAVDNVAFHSNPLDGTTHVRIAGTAGYDPLTIDLAARVDPLPYLRGFVSLQYARWRDAPPPIASFDLDLALGITPSEIHGTFDGPKLKDTISPRVGVELVPEDFPLRARAGWSYAPSPVPHATGFLTPVDVSRHVIGGGAGVALDDVGGVDLHLDINAAIHLASHDVEQKESLALPWARYDAGGHVWQAGASLGGGWR